MRASWKPRIYWDIEIESRASLYSLAQAIVVAFDFDFDHAFGFYDKFGDRWTDADEQYELFADMEDTESEADSVERTPVSHAFPAIGKQLMFLFDYGDEWRFSIQFTKQGEKLPKTRYPRQIASVGKAPPQYECLEDED
jgi:hypothetical protein